MAYSFAPASSQHISASSAPAIAAPLTVACWAYATNYSSPRSLVSIESGSSNDLFLLYINSGGAAAFFAQRAAGTLGQALGGSSSTNTWTHFAGTTSGTSARSVFVNGTSAASDTTNVGSPSVSRVSIGSRYYSGSRGAYMSGSVAEVGIWSAVLDAAELASLAKGVSCRLVRPQSLVFYAPLIRDLVDEMRGLTLTNNNTATVADHPRIYA